MSLEELQAALDYYDRTDHPPMPAVDPLVETARLVANPDLKAMGKVNYALSHNDYSEAELQSLFNAALGITEDPELEPCPICDGSGWYSKTAAQFERDNNVSTGLGADQKMSFPCPNEHDDYPGQHEGPWT